MKTYYSTPEEVLRMVSISPKALDFENVEQLKEFIEQKLIEATDFINTYCDDNFLESTPSGIDGIARDIVINIISSARMSRQVGAVTPDGYPKITDLKIITTDIKQRLDLYKEKKANAFGFVIARVRGGRYGI